MACLQGNRISLDLLLEPGFEPTVSLVPREDSARKLAGLFGTEARPDGDTAANKIFHYIPGTVSGGACLAGMVWHWAWSRSTTLCFPCMIVCAPQCE